MPVLSIASPALLSFAPAAAAVLASGIAAWRLLRTLAVPHAARWAVVIAAIVAPVAGVGAVGLWLAAALLALDAALARRHGAMLAWCGVAVGFGMSAALLAPFGAAVMIAQRVPITRWLLAPAGYAMVWLIGGLAVEQAGALPAPNVWVAGALLLPGAGAPLAGLAIAGVVGASACFIARFSAQMPTAAVRMLPVALLGVLVPAGLSPRGGAGDIALAGAIALTWAIAARERRAWRVAGLIHLGLALAICGSLSGLDALVVAGFGAIALATWLVLRPTAKPAANDNPVMMRGFRHASLATYPPG